MSKLLTTILLTGLIFTASLVATYKLEQPIEADVTQTGTGEIQTGTGGIFFTTSASIMDLEVVRLEIKDKQQMFITTDAEPGESVMYSFSCQVAENENTLCYLYLKK